MIDCKIGNVDATLTNREREKNGNCETQIVFRSQHFAPTNCKIISELYSIALNTQMYSFLSHINLGFRSGVVMGKWFFHKMHRFFLLCHHSCHFVNKFFLSNKQMHANIRELHRMILNDDGEKRKFYLSSCYYLNENVMGIDKKKFSLRKMCSFKKFAKKNIRFSFSHFDFFSFSDRFDSKKFFKKI